MARYPIHVPRNHYGGSKERLSAKAAEYNRRAKIVEDYVNRRVEREGGESHVLFYYSIADECGLTTEQVREVCSRSTAGTTALRFMVRAR